MSSASLEVLVVSIVEGRRSTVIVVFWGLRVASEVRIAVPSSPAPKTRIFCVAAMFS